MKNEYCPIARRLIRAIFQAAKDFADVVECADKQKPRLKVSFGVVRQKTKPMSDKAKMNNEQEVDVFIEPQTVGGSPVKVDGAPQWSVVQGDVTLDVASNGLSAVVKSGNPGTSQVLVKADADLGEGKQEISTVIEVEVDGARAENLGVRIGTPRLKTPANG